MGPDDAIDLFFLHDLSENYIDGCAFIMLNEHDVRELVPPIGLMKKIMSFVPQVSFSDNLAITN